MDAVSRTTLTEVLGFNSQLSFLLGKVVEHERGWGAHFAYPKALFLAADTIPFSLSEINARLKSLSEFGTDIFLVRDCGRVALWKHGSGFDAAGLDYVIKTRKEYLRPPPTGAHSEKGRPRGGARSRNRGG